MYNPTMDAREVITGSQAKCYVTVDGERNLIMNATDIEAKWEPIIEEVPILGRLSVGSKMSGFKGSGTLTAYYNSSLFREIALRYQRTGEILYFDMQISNEDASTTIGRQTVILKNCCLGTIDVAKFAVGEALLTEEVEFTFEEFEMPEKFTVLKGSK